MNKFFFPLLLISLVFIKCKQKETRQVETPRDTTITIINSFTDLFLDSSIINSFLKDKQLDDTAASRIRSFYNSRNYQFAWFIEDGLAEQARSFWNLYTNYVNYSRDSSIFDKQLHQQILLLTEDTTINPSNKDIINTELLLTQHFFQYAKYAYDGRIDPEELQWHIPRKKVNAVALLDSLVSQKGKNLEEWEPVNHGYHLIKKELLRYYDIEKNGGWDSIFLNKKKSFKEGDSALIIRKIKERLFVVNDLTSADTSHLFTSELSEAVKAAQKRFGLRQNGIVDSILLKALNVSVEKRIEQLLINMERMRWLPQQRDSNRIIANIPEFKLHVYEGDTEVFDMDIVVGKEGNNTVVFNDQLKYVVFSPYWNVPRSIVKNEIVPGMAKSPNYLDRQNMEITGTSNGLPVVRQRPGGNNALGQVKFIFPNNYNIYFHDTPSKSLFSRQKRAFSHGCIRLAEPEKMAVYLLRNNPDWTEEKITEAMNSDTEKWVGLKKSVPVFISYFTAWVGNDGQLNFREDIYGHDNEMAKRLFAPIP
ncbi:MAG TPA: L,D-transpeptidase family protein [Chitinophagaceae bacterium]|nr:L,D-transpeptidase family protein [Chitinophagaceae bacterium]